MKKLLLASFACLGLCSSAYAADLQSKPVYKADPAPVLTGNSGFWLGVVGGVGLTPTSNVFAFQSPIVTATNGNTVGYTTGLMAGLTSGYGVNIGSLYVGAAFDALYDFNRGCVDINCVASRNGGFLLEEALEIGSTISTVNGSLPAPLPAPNGLPTSVWSNLAVVARAGYAERTLGLCAFAPNTVTGIGGQYSGPTSCGNGIVAAPLVGAKLKFMASQNSEFFLKWDHVFWGNGYQYGYTVPSAANLLTGSNVVSINHEDLLMAGWGYHF